MQPDQILLTVIILAPIALVFANRLRMDIAALSIAAALGLCQLAGWGLLGPTATPSDAVKAISGFSQPVIITLISLFILTQALEKSGFTRWIANQLIRLSGSNVSLFIFLFTFTTALLSLVMNNLAAGALVLPAAMEVSRRTGIKPAKLLIPIAYGSLLGGAATYFTTANIIASDLLQSAVPPQRALNILDFTPTGGLIAIAGIIFLGLFGDRLLPDREPSEEQTLARLSGKELEDSYQLKERLWEAGVKPSSPLIGQTLRQANIGSDWGISVAAIRREAREIMMPAPDEVIQARDALILVGREEKISPLARLGLEITPGSHLGYLTQQGIHFTEVILSPHSKAQGHSLKQIDFNGQFGLTVVALKRSARNYRTYVGDIPLQNGDSLLCIGTEEKIKLLNRSRDFLVFEPHPGDEPIQYRKAILSVSLILAAITASIAGVPVYLSMLAAALTAMVSGLVAVEEAYDSIEWQAVFLIAGMYAASIAMVQTGLAGLVGSAMIKMVQPMGFLGLAAGAYLLTAILTQFMGGQISALVTGPITISAAISMGVNPQAVAVATAIGCSASFLTPLAHPVNILMIAPANYKFSDFFKAGWPLTILSFLMLLAGMALFW